jgi:hypothetical protein
MAIINTNNPIKECKQVIVFESGQLLIKKQLVVSGLVGVASFVNQNSDSKQLIGNAAHVKGDINNE